MATKKQEETKEVVVAKEVIVEPNFGDKLWEEIKDKPIDMFALPGKRVQDFVSKVMGTANSLLVSVKVGAAIPALEQTLGNTFKVVPDEKYVTVSKV